MSAPPKPQEDDLPEIHTPNARLGMILFVIYTAAYLGFMALAVFDIETMATPSPLGLNWGLLYGLGLIVGAFFMAILYMFLCNKDEPRDRQSKSQSTSAQEGTR